MFAVVFWLGRVDSLIAQQTLFAILLVWAINSVDTDYSSNMTLKILVKVSHAWMQFLHGWKTVFSSTNFFFKFSKLSFNRHFGDDVSIHDCIKIGSN